MYSLPSLWIKLIFKNICSYLSLYWVPLWHWDDVWPKSDLPTQFLPQPQQWQRETFFKLIFIYFFITQWIYYIYKERLLSQAATWKLPDNLLDKPNQPSVINQSWFQAGLHNLASTWKVRLLSKGKKEISQSHLSEISTGIIQQPTLMPLMCPIYSSSPPSFSTYLKARKSGAWIWPDQDTTLMLCGSRLLPLRNTRHAKTQWMLQAFSAHCHPTRLPIHLQMLKGHLCPLPHMSLLGAESPCLPGNNW